MRPHRIIVLTAPLLLACGSDKKTHAGTTEVEKTIEGADEDSKDGETPTYVEQETDAVRLHDSEGADARLGTTVPADFPLELPTAREVLLSQRVVESDRALFQVMMVATSDDVDGIAQDLAEQLTAKGLKFERDDTPLSGQKMTTLTVDDEARKLEVECTVTNDPEGPDKDARVNVVWTRGG